MLLACGGLPRPYFWRVYGGPDYPLKISEKIFLMGGGETKGQWRGFIEI